MCDLGSLQPNADTETTSSGSAAKASAGTADSEHRWHFTTSAKNVVGAYDTHYGYGSNLRLIAMTRTSMVVHKLTPAQAANNSLIRKLEASVAIHDRSQGKHTSHSDQLSMLSETCALMSSKDPGILL